MRYSKEHKDETRQRLLQASAGHAKQHGFAASGVDALASAAGVTAGSLYKHFRGKSDLFASLLRADIDRSAERFAHLRPGDTRAAQKALDEYLSRRHVLHPEDGCPLPALTAEVARADEAVRAAFDDGLRDLHGRLEAIAGSSTNAWALIIQNVGAVMLARAALDPRLQRELLQAARAHGRTLLGEEPAD
jgi:TetR/AcrR family transcriptional regulator, transcriptional repressor for nem operon